MPEMLEPIDLDAFALEVKHGLPNERKRLDAADENQAWYDHDAERYLARREAESEFDFEGRPKRDSGLLRECVEILCDHLYNPGPTRQLKEEGAAAEFLAKVYEQNLFNSLMQQADLLSTLNDACAIQVDAGDGNFKERPIDLLIWSGNEFHAWTHPNNPRKPVAVCTIDRFDMQERRRLWNEVEVRTYVTDRLQDGQTSGGRVAREVDRQPHDYGRIPFAFTHYELPTRYFYAPGIGTFLRKVQERVDDRLSRLDESIQKHLNPIPVAEGVGPDWNPVVEPGRFVRLGPPAFAAITGDFSTPSPTPRLSYLQVKLDIAGAWDDLVRYINQALEAARVPLSYARMEQTGTASGIALIVEQAPLWNRARKRRVPFAHYETEIARAILTCAGNHYGRPELTAAGAGPSLLLGWPEPTITTPGADRDHSDAWRMQMGLASRTQILMERDGCSRDQALRKLEQVARDRADERQILRVEPRGVGEGDDTDPGEPPDATPAPGDEFGTGESPESPDERPPDS